MTSVPNLTYLIHLFVCLMAVSTFSCSASFSSTASDGSTATQFSEYGCRNVQPYSVTCVAVEPSEAVEVKLADQEVVDTAIKHTNKWIKYVKFGTEVVDPASLLKLTQLWL